MKTLSSDSLEATYAIGRDLGGQFDRGDCVALIGPLGAGKTALVRGIAEGLGLDDPRLVSSPTFVLVQEYPGDVPVYHLDLYRMTDPGPELIDLGLDEMLTDGVVLIEWADRAERALPGKHWQIEIKLTGAEQREFRVSTPQEK